MSLRATGHDFKSMLRGGQSDEEIHNAIAGMRREDRYPEIRTEETSRSRKVETSFIGG